MRRSRRVATLTLGGPLLLVGGLTMRRLRLTPRADWTARVEALGFAFPRLRL